jgi:hypothetical protein
VSDQPFYAPNRTPTPRQPRPGKPLWTVQKDGRHLACQLRDDGPHGVEAQFFQKPRRQRDGDGVPLTGTPV